MSAAEFIVQPHLYTCDLRVPLDRSHLQNPVTVTHILLVAMTRAPEKCKNPLCCDLFLRCLQGARLHGPPNARSNSDEDPDPCSPDEETVIQRGG